tara:strand:- start:2 stop:505 length:504 start_codon:yes stop_codon:yes gene_type:complete
VLNGINIGEMFQLMQMVIGNCFAVVLIAYMAYHFKEIEMKCKFCNKLFGWNERVIVWGEAIIHENCLKKYGCPCSDPHYDERPWGELGVCDNCNEVAEMGGNSNENCKGGKIIRYSVNNSNLDQPSSYYSNIVVTTTESTGTCSCNGEYPHEYTIHGSCMCSWCEGN